MKSIPVKTSISTAFKSPTAVVLQDFPKWVSVKNVSSASYCFGSSKIVYVPASTINQVASPSLRSTHEANKESYEFKIKLLKVSGIAILVILGAVGVLGVIGLRRGIIPINSEAFLPSFFSLLGLLGWGCTGCATFVLMIMGLKELEDGLEGVEREAEFVQSYNTNFEKISDADMEDNGEKLLLTALTAANKNLTSTLSNQIQQMIEATCKQEEIVVHSEENEKLEKEKMRIFVARLLTELETPASPRSGWQYHHFSYYDLEQSLRNIMFSTKSSPSETLA